MINDFKKCKSCGISKSLKDFHKNANKDGRFNTCKKCQYSRLQEFRKDPQHKERFKEYRRNNAITKRYGICIQQYNDLVNSQENKCKICGNLPNKEGPIQNQSLHIDHCHKTDKVRGLLCHLCNRGIGLFRERIDLIENAVEYLKKHQ